MQGQCLQRAPRSLCSWQGLSRRAVLPSRARPSASGAGAALPTVLITNDDGPDSPFIKAWVPHVRNTLGCAQLAPGARA